jgi:hypothetical protein
MRQERKRGLMNGAVTWMDEQARMLRQAISWLSFYILFIKRMMQHPGDGTAAR